MYELREGEFRNISGCAISGIFSRSGNRFSGRRIIDSMKVMHERSNGLGGGFAAYGIYPEYKEFYALHVFYDDTQARKDCESFIDAHFDIINLSRIPTRKTPAITDEPLIWRYFVAPLPTRLAESQLDEKEGLILSMYYQHDMSLKEIALVLGLTEARICQINKKITL
ncbi:hypothetical protein EOM86_02890 [Candidatus Nomurabacteria bacterium]|nr:hypothetical protein [Candidatus Nomurabacteria bacterium]